MAGTSVDVCLYVQDAVGNDGSIFKTFSIDKAKAIDITGAESKWGFLLVTMPRNKAINTPLLNFLQNFLHGHPTLFLILQRLLLMRLQ